ncbi:hypothetical protein K493DRAFT_341594 [Basidiobolus meristosporus CBS 931.73]|uniref:Outer arm dynein light chain 1 n=1 Tax=Basidiobolus meristosporus CBS 931.73 TaxID=1314790 RepID=A0A1Y1XLZ4_9FUNG|nr:hypothetical protein K493DRAFT_341594 [Basidiobolus meristosporus CBS 931.73]|eukprot:ORX86715.1 hypothetical protein K493DRAFT_341594 [Basidiobolus meristosporus CBS 931.73]
MILTESLALKKAVSFASPASDPNPRSTKRNLRGLGLKDISVLRNAANLEVLDLSHGTSLMVASVNQVVSIRPLYHCRKLRELYLRRNSIRLSDLKEIYHLAALHVLWLSENPCVEEAHYPSFLIRRLPSLQKLDNKAIQQSSIILSPDTKLAEDHGYPLKQHVAAHRSIGVQTDEPRPAAKAPRKVIHVGIQFASAPHTQPSFIETEPAKHSVVRTTSIKGTRLRRDTFNSPGFREIHRWWLAIYTLSGHGGKRDEK